MKGSELTPNDIIQAYVSGLFPMAEPGTDEIYFYRADPRGLIPLDDRFHIPHGLKRTLKKKPFEIRIDTAFREVITACSRPHDLDEQWIDDNIIRLYCELHDMGFAHSIECWDKDGLQGGLYGVAIGRAFFGESMFHRKSDASKVALVALVNLLRAHDFLYLDTQWPTEHIKKFGTYEIPDKEYKKLLKQAITYEKN